jgi:hypothetical protein
MQLLTALQNGEDHVVLFGRFDADGIHAVFAAQVTGIQPVHLLSGVFGHVAAQEVKVAVHLPLFGSCIASKTIHQLANKIQFQ